MTIAKIPIKGVIGSYVDPATQQEIVGVQLVDVATALHAAHDAEALELEIDSPGGDCDLGYAIYDLIVAANKPTTSIIVGECSSIATVILFAGQTRVMGPGGKPPMIHNPWISGVSGDADTMIMAAADIQAQEDKMEKFYAKNTGVEKSILDSLMKSETYMTVEQALQFKFLTTPATGIRALAFKHTTDMSKKLFDQLNKLTKHFGLDNPTLELEGAKALAITDDAGTAYETNSTGVAPAVGDTITVAGKPAPDGEYQFPDLQLSIECVGGVITQVVPIEATDDGTVAALQLALSNAEKENGELKNKITAFEKTVADTEKTLQVIAARVGIEPYKPTPRTQSFNTAGRTESEVKAVTKDTMNSRRESYKSNKKK